MGKYYLLLKIKFFAHNSSTGKGSSGSPIISRSSLSVIGLHSSSISKDKNPFNLSISIISIINDIKSKVKKIII